MAGTRMEVLILVFYIGSLTGFQALSEIKNLNK